MTEQELIYIDLGYAPELYPWLYPSLYPDAVPPVSLPGPDPTPDQDLVVIDILPSIPGPDSPVIEIADPEPTPDSYPDPVQETTTAISSDELQTADENQESEDQPSEETPADPGDTLAVELSAGDLAVIKAVKGVETELIQISEQLADMQLSGDRPLLTTSFSDYTVMEGLLLLLLLSVFLSACYKLLRGGFQWLRS